MATFHSPCDLTNSPVLQRDKIGHAAQPALVAPRTRPASPPHTRSTSRSPRSPRPIRPIFFEQLSEEIPQYWQRLVARPGLTGFAQLRMRRDMTWSEKLAHDLEYLADRSVPLYLRMIGATTMRICGRVVREVPSALSGRGGGTA